jgi:hypothetical protein
MSVQKNCPASPCYLSTPGHIRSFVGRYLYIYTDKGSVSLMDGILRFRGKKGRVIELPATSITRVGGGSYSRWAKPFRLDYIEIGYDLGEGAQTILLTPTSSWATPTWKTNGIVAEWNGRIESARRQDASTDNA